MNPDVRVAHCDAARTTETVARACDRPVYSTALDRASELDGVGALPTAERRPTVAHRAVRVVTPLPMIDGSGRSVRVLALGESVQEVTDVGS